MTAGPYGAEAAAWETYHANLVEVVALGCLALPRERRSEFLTSTIAKYHRGIAAGRPDIAADTRETMTVEFAKRLVGYLDALGTTASGELARA